MPTLGKYSKSFKLSRFRQFPGWRENAENTRLVKKEVDGDIVEIPRELTGDDYVYLHGDYTVTDSIFIDENIIYSDISPEWIEFCNILLENSPAQEKP